METNKNTFDENMELAEKLIEDGIKRDTEFLITCRRAIKNSETDEQKKVWQDIHDIVNDSLPQQKMDLEKFKELRNK